MLSTGCGFTPRLAKILPARNLNSIVFAFSRGDAAVLTLLSEVLALPTAKGGESTDSARLIFLSAYTLPITLVGFAPSSFHATTTSPVDRFPRDMSD
jgi:hypothetical protein